MPTLPTMAFRAHFQCLWCGRPHQTRGPGDIEGFAQLCPECVGRAQENEFLRFRLREGLRARNAAASVTNPPSVDVASATAGDEEMRAYYAARAPEYDDWYLRRGRYSRGPIADMAWQADLDTATMWLDSVPMSGDIVELAAGTGWWSPLLAQKGELSIYDINEEPLDRARDRLLAHGLRAHIHVRDAWAEPDRQVDALFSGFWLSHVPRERLATFLAIARRWLKPGGVYAFVDSLPDRESGAKDGVPVVEDVAVRRLADGREFRIPKVFYTPAELDMALIEAGFASAEVTKTDRFFLLGRASVTDSG